MDIALETFIPGTISPKLEMGAYEALWALDEASSFKQIKDKLKDQNAQFASQIVSPDIAEKYYQKAITILEKAEVNDFGIRIRGTSDYPQKLNDADHPLQFFYFQGDWDLSASRGISVVGTREPSSEGIQRTKNLVKKLVEKNFTIFSGLAAGIDRVSHATAIESGGRTVAVIGTPLSRFYPKENESLQKIIAKDHLLISQVPVVRYETDSIQFNRFYFPERNKTMSALTEATIIVEAGETSGTLFQARAALKQGRKLFILNSCFENKNLTWPEKFQKKGAIRVHTFDDIESVLNIGR